MRREESKIHFSCRRLIIEACTPVAKRRCFRVPWYKIKINSDLDCGMFFVLLLFCLQPFRRGTTSRKNNTDSPSHIRGTSLCRTATRYEFVHIHKIRLVPFMQSGQSLVLQTRFVVEQTKTLWGGVDFIIRAQRRLE